MEARVARAMELAQGPRISVTDEEVAAQIRREAARKKERAKELGVMSYMLPVAPATNVNKGFLLNTIRGVDSHNKRQEIDQCWRKRDLEAKVHRRRSRSRDRSRSRERRHRRRSSSLDRRHQRRSASRSPSPTRAEDERSYWAERKAARTAELLAQLDGRSCTLENAPNYDESSSSESDEAKAKRAAKKAAKQAKRAKKKAKKKKVKKDARS
ncbi:hypothetical protein SDRG_13221 [Saprolegnia diclina VS20]|uniref:Uncharacterized protein n=1 Tax=Saprolegnia diclina (strain VS20) TaxID=1156394 RepID=T0Q3C6_SAPDV|nr:hypothetical protein SDRG_13221 [Saprolegnia diclina VS20]EQC29066.1 hypothetical protein SDRG_13221 [Saprolegnia diclina VS20]|eukprot:XP_008617525.1 hypothetical protein SDRG_13221 [Saprolegnia diclina VS20]